MEASYTTTKSLTRGQNNYYFISGLFTPRVNLNGGNL
jgi:hypothetical protein